MGTPVTEMLNKKKPKHQRSRKSGTLRKNIYKYYEYKKEKKPKSKAKKIFSAKS